MKKLILLASLMFVTAYIQAQVIAQWRGNDRRGVYNEKDLLKAWPAEGPRLLWTLDDIGNGFGSPAVTSDRLYITGEKDTLSYLYAFDLTGNLLWKTDVGKDWVRSFPGSRSTPTITDELIYVCSGMGNLYCIEAKTGTKKWSVNMIPDLHGRNILHGHSESPVVEGDLVFLTPGGVDTNVVAFNRFTGRIAWISKGLGEHSAYNSPLLIRLQQRNILVLFSGYALMGIDAKTGELLWTHVQDNVPLADHKPGYGDTHSNTAWFENGFIYYIAGDGNGAVKLELSADGKEIKQVWRNQDIDNYMGGFIKAGNNIYSCTSEHKNLVRLDATTGQVLDSLKFGTGTIISADNLLYYYNQKGQLDLIDPSGATPVLVSTFRIALGTKEHFSHPVIDRGILYLRHGKVLMAYDIRKK
jgi:outer membrane protein assembly factor BamB